MRMVISLDGPVVKGLNIMPGGQSGLVESPHFSDQAALWLANKAEPMRFSAQDVKDGANGRELFRPR